MNNATSQHGFLVRALSLVAIGFGLLTIKEGGMTLSGDEAAVSAAASTVTRPSCMRLEVSIANCIAIGETVADRGLLFLDVAVHDFAIRD